MGHPLYTYQPVIGPCIIQWNNTTTGICVETKFFNNLIIIIRLLGGDRTSIVLFVFKVVDVVQMHSMKTNNIVNKRPVYNQKASI